MSCVRPRKLLTQGVDLVQCSYALLIPFVMLDIVCNAELFEEPQHPERPRLLKMMDRDLGHSQLVFNKEVRNRVPIISWTGLGTFLSSFFSPDHSRAVRRLSVYSASLLLRAGLANIVLFVERTPYA